MKNNVFIAAICITMPYLVAGLGCDTQIQYFENYGRNGFEIICEGITKESERILKSIQVYNEVSITIQNSRLENVTKDLFSKVKEIKCLNVLNSTFKFLKDEQTFIELDDLDHLTFENTDIVISNNTFKGLEMLLYLTLNNTNTTFIEEKSFRPLSKLRELTIINNNVTHLSGIPLCELKNLKILNLQNNRILDLQYDFFLCKKRSSPNFDVSLNGENQRVNVEDSFYSVDDDNFEIASINLSHNNISRISNNLEELRSLKYINLDTNFIEALDNATFSHLENLVTVQLSNNLLTFLESNLDHKRKLENLYLQHNRLKSVIISNVSNLQYLDLSYNNISYINLTEAESMETLLLKNNKLTHLEANIFMHLESLIMLDLSENNLTLIGGSFNYLKKLTQLCLSKNNLVTLPEFVFKPLKRLKDLDLSFNKISSFVPNNVLHPLVSLEKLNVSHNLLESVEFSMLSSLKNLKILDLSGNRLQTIQYDLIFSKLPFMRTLSIKANLLPCETLIELMKFLNTTNISYTVNERLDYTKENVGGIYCKSMHSIVASSYSRSALFNFVILLVIVLVCIVISVLVFKIYVYLKRRKYRADEFELVEENT